MKKKLYITRTVKVTCFILALILSLAVLQTYFLRRLDHNSIRLNGYYHEQEGNIDVPMLGASEIYTGFPAGYIYGKYGFTTYPFATESITGSGMLTSLKEIVRTQNPKLIVIEPNSFLYGYDKNETHEGHVRKLIDNIPLNGNKIEYISENVEPDEQIEFYVPLIKYHGIWTEYPSPARRVVSTFLQDIRGYSYLKGFRTTTKSFTPDKEIRNDRLANENKTLALHPTLEKKLRELLDYCKEQKLNVVFVRTPHLVTKDTYNRVKRSNRAAEIIGEYGYDYINLEREWSKIGLEENRDYYNFDHVNIYGAQKVSDYLCSILVNKYGVGKSKLSGKQKENWDEAADCYNRLYRYCDDLIKHKTMIKLEEDINTLRAIRDY